MLSHILFSYFEKNVQNVLRKSLHSYPVSNFQSKLNQKG